MYLYHCYMYTPLHWILLFHIPISLLHRCTQVYDMTVFCIINNDMTFMLYGFPCMHALISCIPVIWIIVTLIFLYYCHRNIFWIQYLIIFCIPDIDMILLLPGYTGNWPKMCETKCHTGQSATLHTWWGTCTLWGPL